MYSTTINTLKDQLAIAEADRDYWRDQALKAQAELSKAQQLIMRHLDQTR